MNKNNLATEWSEVLNELYSGIRDAAFRIEQDTNEENLSEDDVARIWRNIHNCFIDELDSCITELSVVSITQDGCTFETCYEDGSSLYVTMADKPIFETEVVEQLSPYSL